MTGEFPAVDDEPTSELEVLARSDEHNGFIVIDCPDCGNDAFQLDSHPPARRSCRTCRSGKKMFLEYSNYGTDWSTVRDWVLARDSHQCQNCSVFFREMHVHHIENMIWYESTQDAHTPENLETLCRDCHRTRWNPRPKTTAD